MTRRKFLIPFIILITIFIVSISLTVMLIFRNIALEDSFKRNGYEFKSGKYIYEIKESINGVTTNFIYEYDTALRVLEITEQNYKIENGVAALSIKIFLVHIQTNDYTASYNLSTIPETDHKISINIKGDINDEKDKYTSSETFNIFIIDSIKHYEEIIKDSYLPAFIYQL